MWIFNLIIVNVSVEEMLIRIREDGMSNVFDRYAQQEKERSYGKS